MLKRRCNNVDAKLCKVVSTLFAHWDICLVMRQSYLGKMIAQAPSSPDSNPYQLLCGRGMIGRHTTHCC